MGIKEQLIFPEINYDKVDTIKGMNIVFTTTAKTDEEAAALLELLGRIIRLTTAVVWRVWIAWKSASMMRYICSSG